MDFDSVHYMGSVHVQAIEVAQLIDESLDENDANQVLRCLKIADSRVDLPSENVSRSSIAGSEAAFISCFTASWVYSKVILLGISYLERERRYGLDNEVDTCCFLLNVPLQ